MVAAGPDAAIVCGDMNIAPTDADVFDPEAYVGQTHVTPPEREALAELQSLGLRDVVRDHWPDERVFTYWDYRAGMFHKDLGMRIDLVLATAPVAERVQAAWVDRHARKGTLPSDHAPVIVDLDEAPDGDIGPVVPPPSAPAPKRGAHKLPQAQPDWCRAYARRRRRGPLLVVRRRPAVSPLPRRRVGQAKRRDVRLFEKLCLEGFQSGLSWCAILRKREFRRRFSGFEIDSIAEYGPRKSRP